MGNGEVKVGDKYASQKGMRNKRKRKLRLMREAEIRRKEAIARRKERMQEEFEQRYEGWDQDN